MKDTSVKLIDLKDLDDKDTQLIYGDISYKRSESQPESKSGKESGYQPSSPELKTDTNDAQKNIISENNKDIGFRPTNKQKIISWILQKRQRFDSLYKSSVNIWKTQGFSAFANRIYRFSRGERQNSVLTPFVSPVNVKSFEELYKEWILNNEPDQAALHKQKIDEQNFVYRPLISILVPVYNTDRKMLEKMIASVIAQSYSKWELCIADGGSTQSDVHPLLEAFARQDSRIMVKFLRGNHGISGNSNEAIKMAGGEFIALLDHDDELAPDALYENVLLLNKNPQADMIYSDEDKLDLQGQRCDPYFKPDWSPDFFNSSMYTCHLGVYRKSLIEKIGGFRSEFDGAQDYDLVLRLIEQTAHIFHIPKVLYHWRQTLASTALSLDNKDYAKKAQIKAVAGHFERMNVEADVTPGLADNLLRVKRKLCTRPKVSIIIPTRDRAELLKSCIDSIFNLSTYRNYEIIIIDNNSSEVETLAFLDEISKNSRIKVIGYPHQFNFSAMNNFAARQVTGELLLFLNNDTEVISEEWLESMVEHAVRPEVGVVGARLLYSNETIQHAGVIIGIGGVAGHSHKYFPRDHPGYFSRAKAIQNVSAVTAACMMVRAEVFKSFGGFNEEKLAVAFNDVDFCLRIRQANLLIIYTPYAELYHYESISRGADQTTEKALRFQREVEYMLDSWKETLQLDPYYSPNLTLDKEDFSLSTNKIREFSIK